MSELSKMENVDITGRTGENIPQLSSVENQLEIKDNLSAGMVDETMLSEEDKSRINEIADKIDLENVAQTVSYGVEAQRNISDFSVSILKKVRTYDMGEVGNSLRDLTVALDTTVEPEKKGIFRIFQKAKSGINTVHANYAKAESNVDQIERDLLGHEAVLIQDIAVYQQMYELNIQYYKDLTIYILAGKKALDKAKSEHLETLRQIAASSNKQENIQAYRDFEDLCHRFEKKISDLEITRFISIQSAPQIRMLQNNDRELLDKLQSSIANTIPLWRNQLVLSLGIEHSRRSIAAQATLSDKTNELLIQNSEALKMATIETARAAERPFVDMDTLTQCNKNLISSIQEVIKIHSQGIEERMVVRGELVRLEQELQQVLLSDNQ